GAAAAVTMARLRIVVLRNWCARWRLHRKRRRDLAAFPFRDRRVAGNTRGLVACDFRRRRIGFGLRVGVDGRRWIFVDSGADICELPAFFPLFGWRVPSLAE